MIGTTFAKNEYKCWFLSARVAEIICYFCQIADNFSYFYLVAITTSELAELYCYLLSFLELLKFQILKGKKLNITKMYEITWGCSVLEIFFSCEVFVFSMPLIHLRMSFWLGVLQSSGMGDFVGKYFLLL